MTALDVARREMALHGREMWDKAIEVAEYAREKIKKLDGFKVITEDIINGNDIYAFDPIKLTINVEDLGYSGFEFERYLIKWNRDRTCRFEKCTTFYNYWHFKKRCG